MQRNWFNLCGIEAAVVHEKTYPSRKDEYGPALANLIETGRALRGTDYQKILLQRAAYTGRMRALMRQVDALLVPTTPIASPTVAQMHVSGQEYVDIWFAMMRYGAAGHGRRAHHAAGRLRRMRARPSAFSSSAPISAKT